MNSYEAKEEELKEVKRIKNIARLLKKFNIQTYGFSPYVRGYVIGHGTQQVIFDSRTWKFIEPLLKELLRYRNINSKSKKIGLGPIKNLQKLSIRDIDHMSMEDD